MRRGLQVVVQIVAVGELKVVLLNDVVSEASELARIVQVVAEKRADGELNIEYTYQDTDRGKATYFPDTR